jgi:hypothetical protein
VNAANPQCRQTTSVGKTQTIGLSRPSSRGKWIATSPLNVLWLSDLHRLQVTSHSSSIIFHKYLRGEVSPITEGNITDHWVGEPRREFAAARKRNWSNYRCRDCRITLIDSNQPISQVWAAARTRCSYPTARTGCLFGTTGTRATSVVPRPG